MAVYAYGLHSFDGSSTNASTDTTLYTAPAGVDTFLLGLLICNIASSNVTIDLKIADASAGTIYIAKNLQINENSTLQFLQEERTILEGGDYLAISCDTANALNVATSVMEITPDS